MKNIIPIKAVGNKLNVHLQGVNIEGMEYWGNVADLQNPSRGRNETQQKYNQIKAYNFNCIRHPFAVDLFNADCTHCNSSYVAYREFIRTITQYCLNAGLYIIWEPHRWNHQVGGSFDMTDETIYRSTMRTLANLIKDFSNVAIGLANEPWVTGWRNMAQIGLNEVRGVGYDGLVISPMGGWDCVPLFVNNPLTDPLNNIAYDTHIYWYWRGASQGNFTENTVQGILNYLQAYGIPRLATTYPLTIGEFGAYDQRPEELLFVKNLATLCNREKWAWMYWVYDLRSLTVWGMLSDWNTLNVTGKTVVSLLSTPISPVLITLIGIAITGSSLLL